MSTSPSITNERQHCQEFTKNDIGRETELDYNHHPPDRQELLVEGGGLGRETEEDVAQDLSMANDDHDNGNTQDQKHERRHERQAIGSS